MFDEEVLPFVVMHSNAGGLLHSQILLLTSDFLNRGGQHIDRLSDTPDRVITYGTQIPRVGDPLVQETTTTSLHREQ